MRSSIDICSGGSTIRGLRVRALEHAAERGHQAEQIDFELRLVVVAGDVRDALVGAHVLRAAQRLALVQQLGGGLVLLVLEQPAHQRLARILFVDRRSSSAGVGRGSSMRDLMWISVAAMTRNSPATSRFSSCISVEVRAGTAR